MEASCHSEFSSIASGFDTFVDDGRFVTSQWEEDSGVCRVCTSKLGKMRRHHCRLCGASVCGPCSPSLVQMDGFRCPQRACTPCIASLQTVPLVKCRLVDLSNGLRELGNARTCTMTDAGNLLDAVALCEAALLPVEETLATAKGHARRAEAEAASIREARRQLETEVNGVKGVLANVTQRLEALGGAASPRFGNAHADFGTKGPVRPGSLREAASACENALARFSNSSTRRGHSAPARARASSGPARGTDVGSSLLQSMATVSEDYSKGSTCVSNPVWEDNSTSCSICNSKIGKRYFNRRHHCRVCGRCVCGKCSPSSMQMEGLKQMQRVCTHCATNAQQGHMVSRRFDSLLGRIQSLVGDNEVNGVQPPTPRSADEAYALCEAAVAALEKKCSPKPSPKPSPRSSGSYRPRSGSVTSGSSVTSSVRATLL